MTKIRALVHHLHVPSLVARFMVSLLSASSDADGVLRPAKDFVPHSSIYPAEVIHITCLQKQGYGLTPEPVNRVFHKIASLERCTCSTVRMTLDLFVASNTTIVSLHPTSLHLALRYTQLPAHTSPSRYQRSSVGVRCCHCSRLA